MKLVKRMHGSQRASKHKNVEFEPNFAGQNGAPFLTFKTEEGQYLMFHFESLDELRELSSQAAILWHNWRDEQ